MPGYVRGVKRDQLRFVLVNPFFCYGWKTIDLAARTGISAADLTSQLGHMTADVANAISNRIMVTGANSPKPARVTRKATEATLSTAASTSTFMAYDKGAAAAAANWNITSFSKGVRLTANVNTRRSVSAIATLSNGALFVFPLNQVDFDLVKANLGLKSAAEITTDTEKRSLVTGSRTRPGRASIDDGDGILSTFYSTASEATARTNGWNIEAQEFIEYSAPAAPPPAP